MNFNVAQDFGKVPNYLNRMKMEAAEAARLWEAEQEAERNRKESMILNQEEKDNILQVYNIMLVFCKLQIFSSGSPRKLDTGESDLPRTVTAHRHPL